METIATRKTPLPIAWMTSWHRTILGDFMARWSSVGLTRLEWKPLPENTEIISENWTFRGDEKAAESLQKALCDYQQGNFQSLDTVPVDGSGWSVFFAEVYRHCRAIPPGETMSYGELASLSGSGKAARAVGQAMRNNQIPLLIPCHRVVGSGGKLHGYSGPGGLITKQRLLDHERGLKSLTELD